jgi:hypothetical protein
MDTEFEDCMFLLTSMIESQDLYPVSPPDRDSFPEDHESRVKWAKDNRHSFRYKGARSDIDLPYVYCALATVGLLDGDIVLEGNTRQRLFLAKTAREWGIPIDPTNVYHKLEFCSCPRLVIESVLEMIEHGHCPSEADWASIVTTLKGMRFDLNPAKVDVFPEKLKWWMQRLVVDLWFSSEGQA